MIDSDMEWEELGRRDPYYGVLSCDKFRMRKLDAGSIHEFFHSGEDHITHLLEIVRRFIDPEFAPGSSLDFGCGVGRCTIPLARVCKVIVGVDVSDSMLKEARNNLLQRSISNVTFIKTDEMLSKPLGPFDFIHSVLVFQHIPQPKGEKILERLLSLLSDGGVLAIQFLYHRSESTFIQVMGKLRKRLPLLHNVANLIYGHSFAEPLMEKNVYDLNRVLHLLKNYAFSNVHLTLLPGESLDQVILLCQRQRVEKR
jgi:2-polyprenyl-3-methyl-5-hydroxy-6-metoxy-1,4-benzoquinol methylase